MYFRNEFRLALENSKEIYQNDDKFCPSKAEMPFAK